MQDFQWMNLEAASKFLNADPIKILDKCDEDKLDAFDKFDRVKYISANKVKKTQRCIWKQKSKRLYKTECAFPTWLEEPVCPQKILFDNKDEYCEALCEMYNLEDYIISDRDRASLEHVGIVDINPIVQINVYSFAYHILQENRKIFFYTYRDYVYSKFFGYCNYDDIFIFTRHYNEIPHIIQGRAESAFANNEYLDEYKKYLNNLSFRSTDLDRLILKHPNIFHKTKKVGSKKDIARILRTEKACEYVLSQIDNILYNTENKKITIRLFLNFVEATIDVVHKNAVYKFIGDNKDIKKYMKGTSGALPHDEEDAIKKALELFKNEPKPKIL